MTDESKAARQRGDKQEKRPYAPPRILSRELLEAIAGTCSGGGKENTGRCPNGPIAS